MSAEEFAGEACSAEQATECVVRVDMPRNEHITLCRSLLPILYHFYPKFEDFQENKNDLFPITLDD